MVDETLPREEPGRTMLRRLYAMSATEALDEMAIEKMVAARELMKRYRSHKEGDKGAVLEALYICVREQFPLPVWCEVAYLERFRKVLDRGAGSWDDVFGRPWPKGSHLGADEQRVKFAPKVFSRVLELHKAGHAIDANLFEKVGRELGIGGKTLTEKYYYDFRNRLKNDPLLGAFEEAVPRIKTGEVTPTKT